MTGGDHTPPSCGRCSKERRPDDDSRSVRPPGGQFPPAPHRERTMEKHTHIIIPLAAAAMAALLASCSVKEDRTDCPCWLEVHPDPFPSKGAVISAHDGGTMLFRETLFLEDTEDGLFRKAVRKGFHTVTCRTRIPGRPDDTPAVTIPLGEQADSMYAHTAVVDCTGETAVDMAAMHKQFATVHMMFVSDSPQEHSPYWIIVRGGVDGMDTVTLEPHEGPFEYRPAETLPMYFQFRVPRQKDASLEMDLHARDDGRYLDTVHIGQLIEQTGFNWGAESLEDIMIRIDIGRADFSVEISEWESGADIHEII